MSDRDDAYISNSQRRVLRMIELLAAKPLDGFTPGRAAAAMVDAAGEPLHSKDQCFRTLKTMEAEGWVEQTHGGEYRIAPRVTNISERVRVAIAELHRTYLAKEESNED